MTRGDESRYSCPPPKGSPTGELNQYFTVVDDVVDARMPAGHRLHVRIRVEVGHGRRILDTAERTCLKRLTRKQRRNEY